MRKDFWVTRILVAMNLQVLKRLLKDEVISRARITSEVSSCSLVGVIKCLAGGTIVVRSNSLWWQWNLFLLALLN